MGSTGSGSFTDYSKRKPSSLKGGDGGESGTDNCGKAISTQLEDVSRCFYFMNTKQVPTVGTEVNIFFNGVRLSVETIIGEEIGYIPTKYNYLKNCLDAHFSYSGRIISSSTRPIPSVLVDITPK